MNAAICMVVFFVFVLVTSCNTSVISSKDFIFVSRFVRGKCRAVDDSDALWVLGGVPVQEESLHAVGRTRT